MRKGEIKSRARHYEDLPKIPTFVTKNYNRAPHYISFKLWCAWGLDKKPITYYINPDYADLFDMTRDEAIENNKKIEAETGRPNPLGDVLLPVHGGVL